VLQESDVLSPHIITSSIYRGLHGLKPIFTKKFPEKNFHIERLHMNERIGKLAEQAGLLGPSSRVGNSHEATEKFAELIVAECVAICQDIDGEDNIDARSGRQDCAVEIKQHFGVSND
jgi:hypothetical protein